MGNEVYVLLGIGLIIGVWILLPYLQGRGITDFNNIDPNTVLESPSSPEIPSIVGQNGKILYTDGTELQWQLPEFTNMNGIGGYEFGFGLDINVQPTKTSVSLNKTDLNLFGDQRWAPKNLSFLDLNDTPDSYTGQDGNLVRVNATGTGLEFIDVNLATSDVNNALFLGGYPASNYGRKGVTSLSSWLWDSDFNAAYIRTFTDTNWQTDWLSFDTNMRQTYYRQDDANTVLVKKDDFNSLGDQRYGVKNTTGLASWLWDSDFNHAYYSQTDLNNNGLFLKRTGGVLTGDVNANADINANSLCLYGDRCISTWPVSSIDTNWQTSFDILDSNLQSTYLDISRNLTQSVNGAKTFSTSLSVGSTNANALLVETTLGADKFRVDTASSFIYSATIRGLSNNAYDLGLTSTIWRTLFVNDINAANDINAHQNLFVDKNAFIQGDLNVVGRLRSQEFEYDPTTWGNIYEEWSGRQVASGTYMAAAVATGCTVANVADYNTGAMTFGCNTSTGTKLSQCKGFNSRITPMNEPTEMQTKIQAYLLAGNGNTIDWNAAFGLSFSSNDVNLDQGIWLVYKAKTNTWWCRTGDGSGTSETNTGISTDPVTWRLEYNGGGIATYYLNGQFACTQNSKVPFPVYMRPMYCAQIESSVATTDAATILQDYLSLKIKRGLG